MLNTDILQILQPLLNCGTVAHTSWYLVGFINCDYSEASFERLVVFCALWCFVTGLILVCIVQALFLSFSRIIGILGRCVKRLWNNIYSICG